MSSFSSQSLVIANTPVGLSKNKTNPTRLKIPQRAFGIVEGNDIRISCTDTPTTTIGLLATVGSSITIVGESDIESFLAISTNPAITAYIYFEISDNLA